MAKWAYSPRTSTVANMNNSKDEAAMANVVWLVYIGRNLWSKLCYLYIVYLHLIWYHVRDIVSQIKQKLGSTFYALDKATN